ncbi:HGGxSTG domain-containing protein [Methylobacterium sp. A54F]
MPFRLARRCCAKTRSGEPCRSPAVSGKARCRMHGGAKGSGAPKGRQNGAYRHGLRTQEMKAAQRTTRELIQQAKETLGWA